MWRDQRSDISTYYRCGLYGNFSHGKPRRIAGVLRGKYMPERQKGLSPKQQWFVAEYLIDLNGTQAAIRAGYSKKTARMQGCRLLTHDDIKAAVAEGRKATTAKLGATQERVIEELAKMAFSDIRKIMTAEGNLLSPAHIDDETAGAIAGVETVARQAGFDAAGERQIEYVHKIKLWDKNSALEKLAKHLGMFVDKSEVDHTFTVNIGDDDADCA
jgi:phage terminase small subunit